MKITGVAPKIAVPTFAYIILTTWLDYLWQPVFNISAKGSQILSAAGIIMIIAGAGVVAAVGRKLLKFFDEGVLLTGGLFRIVRNPMYCAYLILIIPGIALLLNSWLVMTAVVFNFIIFKMLIRGEYEYLKEKFGAEYERYLKTVYIKFL